MTTAAAVADGPVDQLQPGHPPSTPDAAGAGQVAERWRRLIEGDGAAYHLVQIPLAKVEAMARSEYVESVVAATHDGDAVLEAGCGSGTISLALARRGRRVVSLDNTPAVLANLAANRNRLSAETRQVLTVQTVRGDLERLPFADKSFAAVINEGVVEHWLDRPARQAVMREMARVVRPGGLVAVYVPNGRHPLVGWWERTRYPGYARSVSWHKYGWRDLGEDLEAAGLMDVQVDGLSPYSTIAVWPNWSVLRALAALLRRILPAPRWLRLRCGFNLQATGRVRPV